MNHLFSLVEMFCGQCSPYTLVLAAQVRDDRPLSHVRTTLWSIPGAYSREKLRTVERGTVAGRQGGAGSLHSKIALVILMTKMSHVYFVFIHDSLITEPLIFPVF